jgi:penicillin-binding protein 1A
MRKLLIANFLLAMLLTFGMAFTLGCLALYAFITKDLPSITKIKDYAPSLVTTVYTNDGQILGYLYREKRFLVQLPEVPPHTVKAFLAAEDSSFYEHEGLDVSAIGRAFLKNMQSGEIVQGGSTITQQIIKQLLLGSEKKYERKVKEAILSFQLENFLNKDEILTIYLNQVFFGAGSYGVEAAARTFFGKHVGDLSIAESAVLAGLPKAPSNYNPFHNPEFAKNRQRYVLHRMRELGWINEEEYKQAQAENLVFHTMPEPSWGVGAYYMEEVRRWLIEHLSKENMKRQGLRLDRYGEDAVYESGLHVYTGIDLDHQEAAERALRKGLEAFTKRHGWHGAEERVPPAEFKDFLAENAVDYEELKAGDWVKALVLKVDSKGAHVRVGNLPGFIPADTMAWSQKGGPSNVVSPGDAVWTSFVGPPRRKADKGKPVTLSLALEQWPKIQGALVSFEPKNGRVLALVGGYSFGDSQFNRATQAHRQPGSAFKPIVYSAALDNGFTPTSVVQDSPISFGNWAPKNYGGHYDGAMTLEHALAKSKNVVTARIAARMGIKTVIERARTLGLEAEFPPYLPICLGAEALTPINLCQAYSAFARDGSYIRPRMVLSVKRAWGEELYLADPTPVPAISPKTAFTMATMLKGVIQHGTSVRAKVLGRPLAGKTGTTNAEKDAWFIGFSPYLLSGVYLGFDHLTPMGRGEAGSSAALPIWIDYRSAVEPNYPVEDFHPPTDVKMAQGAKYPKLYETGGRGEGGARLTSATHEMREPIVPARAKPTSAPTKEELLKMLY